MREAAFDVQRRTHEPAAGLQMHLCAPVPPTENGVCRERKLEKNETSRFLGLAR